MDDSTPTDDSLTAYHEASHAIECLLAAGADTEIVTISIVRKGNDLGNFQYTPPVVLWREDWLAELRITLAGWVGEELFIGERPAQLDYFLRFGVHPRWDRPSQEDLIKVRLASIMAQPQLDDVSRLRSIRYHYGRTRAALRRNWGQVTALAEALLSRRTLCGAEVVDLVSDDLVWTDQTLVPTESVAAVLNVAARL
jgi:ATP-dependent Zn protease